MIKKVILSLGELSSLMAPRRPWALCHTCGEFHPREGDHRCDEWVLTGRDYNDHGIKKERK